jgi:hypothetical protein
MEKQLDEEGNLWSPKSLNLIQDIEAYERKVLQREQQLRQERERQLGFPFFNTPEVRNMPTTPTYGTDQTKDTGSRPGAVHESDGRDGESFTGAGYRPISTGTEPASLGLQFIDANARAATYL